MKWTLRVQIYYGTSEDRLDREFSATGTDLVILDIDTSELWPPGSPEIRLHGIYLMGAAGLTNSTLSTSGHAQASTTAAMHERGLVSFVETALKTPSSL